MKKIREIVTKVTSVTYDESSDSYKASIDSNLPCPIWTGSESIYKEQPVLFLEFGTVDLHDIAAGDVLTVETYEHLAGETAKLSHGEEFTFLSDGYHNVITAVTKCYKTELGKLLSALNYKDDSVKEFDNLAFHLYCIPAPEKEELIQALVWCVYANGVTLAENIKKKFDEIYANVNK